MNRDVRKRLLSGGKFSTLIALTFNYSTGRVSRKGCNEIQVLCSADSSSCVAFSCSKLVLPGAICCVKSLAFMHVDFPLCSVLLYVTNYFFLESVLYDKVGFWTFKIKCLAVTFPITSEQAWNMRNIGKTIWRMMNLNRPSSIKMQK